MGQAMFLCALVALVACVPTQPDADHAQADYQMSLTGTYVPSGDSVSSGDLINGDFAEDTTDEGLQRGPKVNGGFAMNVIPTRQAGTVSKVANADCAGGYFINGKCVHPFPRSARKATLEDNMQSPEQHTEGGYEVDIHSFVRKHFGQRLMEETLPDEHHVAMPGAEITSFEMNKEGNAQANEAAEDLLPIGTDMMNDGNTEEDVKMHKVEMNVRHHVPVPKIQPSSEKVAPVAGEPEGTGSSVVVEGDVAGEAEKGVESSGSVTSTAPQSQAPLETEGEMEEYVAPPALSEQGEEVAENASPSVEVEDEVGDVEAQIPHVEVEAEPGLPPTPTPTPTPNYEEIAAAEAAAAEHKAQIDSCVALLEKEDIQCSNTPAEAEAMGGALIQTAAEPTEPRAKFQALLLDCTSKSSQNLAAIDATSPTASAERSAFTASLVKYASAMACVDAVDFPSCVPSEAAANLEKPRPEWTCF